MDLIEFIGFFITLLAFVYLAVQQVWGKAKARHAGEQESEEEHRFRRELDALYSDDEELFEDDASWRERRKKKPMKTVAAVKEKTGSDHWEFHTPKESSPKEPSQASNPYALGLVGEDSRGYTLVAGKKMTLQEAMVLREILGKPRAVESHDEHW